jgi:hypothetical protein
MAVYRSGTDWLRWHLARLRWLDREERRRSRADRARLATYTRLADMACERPKDGCDCCGCSLARETDGQGEP